MKALSIDLRRRIVEAYEVGKVSYKAVAERFGVSAGTVRNLVKLKQNTGSLSPRYDQVPGPPLKITKEKQAEMIDLVSKQPDLTLEQIKNELKLNCTVQAIHYALIRLGYSFKKRHFEPQSKTEKTSK